MFIWGVQPDAMAYNTMIKLCAETNQYEKAMTFLEDMDMDDHRPSRITMEALIRAAATAPQWIRVRETLAARVHHDNLSPTPPARVAHGLRIHYRYRHLKHNTNNSMGAHAHLLSPHFVLPLYASIPLP